ncbi:hypothetical protein [Blastomonas fulva]|uniref:hypothetical protein n=1 Tax=Blastomonas fulva TaxID=1550728 RepID=UPI0025A4338E|nr:hypothetical protein [Blastomonas fulva]MDM7964477.1 hypothetical protein [Blastomonas fulva]
MMHGRRQSNIRPVRGITADTVRALLALRHAGTDCAYLPIERTRLADQVKGSAPAPCIDLADVPATLRADCDSYPATPVVIGFDLAAKGTDRTVVSLRGRKGHVIIDEYFETPSVAQPAPLGCDDEARSAGPTEPTAPATPVDLDDAERAYDAALGKERRARGKNDRADYAGADQGRPEARADRSDRKAGRLHGSARPGAAARAFGDDGQRDTPAPVLKPQRIDLIRDIAARLEERKTPAPRPIAAPRIERKPLKTLAPDPIAQRREAIERAIRFLKSRCILVDITDRTAAIRKYRVSGKRDTMLAEQVIEHAKAMGMEPAHP